MDGNITMSYVLYFKSYPSASNESSFSQNWTALERLLAPAKAGASGLFEVPVLTRDMVYEFSVQATNQAGASPFSASTYAVIPSILSRPQIISASIVIGGSQREGCRVQLRWTGDNATVLYYVDYKLESSSEWLTTKFVPNYYGFNFGEVRDLIGGAIYEFKVTGEGYAGIRGLASLNYKVTVATTEFGNALLQPPQVQVSGDTAAIQWAPSAYTGLPVTYTIYTSELDPYTLQQTPFIVLASEVADNTLTAVLHESSIYFFKVQPSNELGQGPQSLASSPAYHSLALPAPSNIAIGNASRLIDSSLVLEVAWQNQSSMPLVTYQVCVANLKFFRI